MSRVVLYPPGESPAADGTRTAGWWHDAEQPGRVMCDVCPRGCTLRPGDRGFCFVRENRGGQMVSTTYGRSTGFCVDPIEKKPLHHFYPGTAVLSFGTAGCNLGCKFCQNWSMSRSRDVEAASEVAAPETVAAAAQRLGCRSVAFTYNDPIVWTEYAIDTARACRAAGIKTVAVTSGYMRPEARKAFYHWMDAANVDLKAFREEFYAEMTGGHLQPVLDTLRWIARESDAWLEITNLVIPRANDSPDDIRRMCEWIAAELGPDVPLHFSAFHPDFKLTDRGRTPMETLLAAHDLARAAGLRYVYTGNVSDLRRQATYCPGCGRAVIERVGYEIGAYRLRDGGCEFCGAPIAGHFDPQPGNWGGRRQSVDIAAFAGVLGRQLPELGRQLPELGPQLPELGPQLPELGPQLPELGPQLPELGPQLYCRPTEEETRGDSTTVAPTGTNMASAPKPPAADRPALSKEQENAIFRAAGRHVAATVRSQRPDPLRDALAETAAVPVYGAFVSLKRAGHLRSCCGFMGESIPLSDALEHAAIRAAKDDPRFPPISASELTHLDMEVWILWGREPMTARGEDRVRAFTIGKHGLQVARGNCRGLLLPGVAVEHHLDAPGFLRQVCIKAGLAPDAWKLDDTHLMTFEGYAIRGRFPAESEAGDDATPPGAPTPAELAALVTFCRGNLAALLRGATPTYYLTGGFDGQVQGIALSVGLTGEQQRIECNKLSLRPAMPLQTTLFSLVEATAQVLRNRRVPAAACQTAPLGLTVLVDPVPQGSLAHPDLAGIDPRRRAVLVRDAVRSAWVFDPARSVEELLEEAARMADVRSPAAAAVATLAAVSTEPRAAFVQGTQPRGDGEVRPPAVAGTFYPGRPEQVEQALDELFAEPPRPEPWAGAMVPHAGWKYSGSLAAAVFSRVQIPPQVIVFCPRHHPGGAQWAVAPHRRWLLPGREIESDPELAARLTAGVSGLELDAVPHRQEHAIEVQLPLLARVAPQTRVVGVTIGGGELSSLFQFAAELAAVLRELPQRPLLVISSDMNHFADDTQTRQIDALALEAMQSLDPSLLYRTVREHRISMCGMLPAVLVMETLRQLGALTRCELVGYATSADASGDTHRVVGYAGMLLG